MPGCPRGRRFRTVAFGIGGLTIASLVLLAVWHGRGQRGTPAPADGQPVAAADRAGPQEREAAERILRLDQRLTELALLGGSPWLDAGRLEPSLQQELADLAIHLHLQALEAKAADPAVRLETAAVYRRVAGLQHLLGQQGRAREALDQAVRLLTQLVAEVPDQAAPWCELGCCRYHLGVLDQIAGQQARAADSFQQAVEVRERLVRDYADDPEFPTALAGTCEALGLLHEIRCEYSQAEPLYRRA